MKGTGATAATRGTGRSEGVVGVSSTGIELGLKVGGIGQLGISTDYGGGIVIGIFGQKIVWGREGGKIHYNFGGLEVIVEARDCVVVETRKILGQVAERHVYPDPGCKLPPEPKPETPEPPKPPGPDGGIDLPDTDEVGWVIFDMREAYYQWGRIDNPRYNNTTIRAASDIKEKDRVSTALPFKIISTKNPYGALNYTIQKDTPIHNFTTYTTTGTFGNVSVAASQPYPANTFIFWYVAGFYGRVSEIKRFIDINKKNNEAEIAENLKTRFTGAKSYYFYIPTKFVPLNPKEIKILPSAGNQPPMPESCCEALSADIADIKEVLATKEILAGKMTFPWKWRMPGGEGEEIIMDYPNLMRAIAQMIDHLGIHPPKLSIKDINNAVAGDQSISNQFPSATQGFEALMAQIWDANADVDTLTNFLYRLSWLCVQQSMNIARMSGDVQCIKDMFGGETIPTDTSITTPFNIVAGIVEKPTKGQGFGKEKGKIDNRIDANTEIATESLLPDFLKIRENPIVVERFSGEKDLFDLIAIIILKLESLQRT